VERAQGDSEAIARDQQVEFDGKGENNKGSLLPYPVGAREMAMAG